MSNIAETLKFENGIVAKILWDDHNDIYDPREWENIGVMVCGHPDYRLGDEQFRPQYATDIWQFIANHEQMPMDCNVCGKSILHYDEDLWYHASKSEYEDFDEEDDFQCEGAEIVPVSLDVVVLPLYLYDHSGISMSTSDSMFRAIDGAGWDWGMVGVIYTTRKRMEDAGLLEDEDNELTWQPKAREVLKQEVETYDLYLTGQRYGYVIENEDGDHLDSCWGFLGSDSVEEGAKAAAESYVDKVDSERASAKLPISQSE